MECLNVFISVMLGCSSIVFPLQIYIVVGEGCYLHHAGAVFASRLIRLKYTGKSLI